MSSSGIQDSLNLIEIRNNVAVARHTSAAASVESGAFEGLNIAFRPHLLTLILSALNQCATVRAWHNDRFCVIKSDEFSFGFELVSHSLPELPVLDVTDTFLITSTELKTVAARAYSMFGQGAILTATSDERGAGTLLIVAQRYADSSSRRLEATLSAARSGTHVGPIKFAIHAAYLNHALQRFSRDANAQLDLVRSRIHLVHETEGAKYTVLLHAKIQQ
jgi:hypothetical protein